MLPVVSIFADKVGSKIEFFHRSISPLKVIGGDRLACVGKTCALDTVDKFFHFVLLLFGFGFGVACFGLRLYYSTPFLLCQYLIANFFIFLLVYPNKRFILLTNRPRPQKTPLKGILPFRYINIPQKWRNAKKTAFFSPYGVWWRLPHPRGMFGNFVSLT